jgi:perosamine synthetase
LRKSEEVIMKPAESYKMSIASVLGTDTENVFLYWKGRVALYALLKAAGIGEGDEVILSGLTCVVVPNAIKYLKAKPVYVDVNPETYNPDFNSYIEKISLRTKVLIVQNTFGLSSDVDLISHFARQRNIITIEDCTHGFGGRFKDMMNGSYCDAAIYSTQWNKPFSTGIGGFCLVNDRILRDKLLGVNQKLIQPGILDNISLSLLMWTYRNLLNEKTYWTLRTIYRKLSMAGIVIGSSQGKELKYPSEPGSYFKGASKIQIKHGLRNIQNLLDILKLRERNAQIYSDFLKEKNKTYVSEKYRDDHSFLVYPLLVKDREIFNKNAEIERVRTGDWFISPLHPVKSDLNLWDLDEKNVPNASFLSKHLVNLPTSENKIIGVLGFLERNLDNII